MTGRGIIIFTCSMQNPSPDKVTVIIPAFNEAPEQVEQTLSSLLNRHYRVILVDDGSALPLQPAAHPLLRIIRHRVNLGQGAALQTGMDAALQEGADYIISFDADGQHEASAIPALLQPLLEKEADIVFASRFLQAGQHNAGIRRTWLLQLARRVNFLFTGVMLSDAHNGLRAMSREAAQKIRLKENRMAHATEILIRVKQQQLRLREVPAGVRYTDYSRNKGQSSLNGFRILFDLFLHKLFE